MEDNGQTGRGGDSRTHLWRTESRLEGRGQQDSPVEDNGQTGRAGTAGLTCGGQRVDWKGGDSRTHLWRTMGRLEGQAQQQRGQQD